jgi:hypothetical protein
MAILHLQAEIAHLNPSVRGRIVFMHRRTRLRALHPVNSAVHRNAMVDVVAPGYSSLKPNEQPAQEHIMNIAKNMEAIFLAAICLVSLTTMAHAAVPARLAAQPAANVASDANMMVVTVVHKRLSAAEKAQLDD